MMLMVGNEGGVVIVEDGREGDEIMRSKQDQREMEGGISHES